ncbi:centromere protein F-like [Larimichthys crocea]|uniref:centromere protein F-like n=1 Tax=Larimichthys crocea TaxID=215358 RepID=UPI000F6022CB|nr:centromere protein F-like [Larimichthys crocea]
MRVGFGLVLLLLGQCGLGAQGEGGGLSDVGEIREFQKTHPRDAVEESSKQTTPDIWDEVRALRDMMVELKADLKNMVIRLKASESQVNELKAELIVTKVHVELLQRENSVQTTELMSLETRLSATESEASDLQKQNADLQARLSSSESELLTSKSRIDQLEKENADLQARLSSSESELLTSKSRIDQLEKENAAKPKVAFYTALTRAGRVGPYNMDTTLKYSIVHTNIGNAYSPTSGFFTAPVKGLYYLQFTVSEVLRGYMGVKVYKNNQRIMYNQEFNHGDSHGYFTNSVILELIAGDIIYLALPSGQSAYDNGNNHNTFSGALLFPL